MKVKNLINKIHLWLGLTSGLIVFIIAITGCIYAFQAEIQEATQSYRHVKPESRTALLPSAIREIGDKALPGKHIHAVLLQDESSSAQVIYFSLDPHYFYIVYVNQYTGEVLKVKDMEADFFSFILDGHFYLWLPDEIGQTVIATATLIFFFLLVTGIILVIKRKGAGSEKLKIRWNARWRRKNYDLHNVMGLYVSIVALIFIFTGLIWGFQWFRNGVFKGLDGKEYIEYYIPPSDTTAAWTDEMNPLDRVYLQMRKEYPDAEWIEVHPPEDRNSSIAANANPDKSTYWKIDYRYFDQYTLKELPVDHIWNRIHQSSNTEMLYKMNYDIHTGAIMGLPGKFLAFCASLIIASLPVTGFLIWYGRRKKEKKGQA